jgi:molybdopterin molybdotransferase
MVTFQREREGTRMLPVEEAQARVLSEVSVLPPEEVSFGECVGRVLREDVAASHDAPERDNSAMDGYAVRAEDLPGALRVIGDVPAGSVPSMPVERGTAVRIMTGAFVPDGADTVVQVELTDAGSETVNVQKALAQGANIRRRGEDMRAGDIVLRAGTCIGAPEIAVLASVQRRFVSVGRRPTVAILSTGDELIGIGDERTPGKIVNTNEHLLAALVAEAGGIARPLGIVRDTREATIEALASAASSGFVITSGGVSVGAYDFVKDALDALGAETRFWQIAMKPGKPVVLSRLRESVIFGLPGNPVSCFVSFHLFVAPALRKSSGQEVDLFPPVVRARLTAPLRAAADRRVYFRVNVIARDGELLAAPRASQGSGSLTSMLNANGLAQVEAGAAADADSLVPVLLIGPVSSGSPR